MDYANIGEPALFDMSKQREKLPSLFVYTSHTCTSLCVARLDRFAYTILPAIRRRRIAARSVVSPATTRCRACPKPRPSTIKCTVACNAICDATDRSLFTRPFHYNKMNKSLLRGVDGMQSNNLTQNKNNLIHLRQQAVPAQACVLHALIASPVHPLPPFAGAGSLQVLL